jgi:hypothetical protein
MAGVRELKAILARRGVDASQAIEKADLEKLVADTNHLENGNGGGGGSGSKSSAAAANKSGAAAASTSGATTAAASKSGGGSGGQQESRVRRSRTERKVDEFMRLASAAETLGVAVDAPDEVVQAAHKAYARAALLSRGW